MSTVCMHIRISLLWAILRSLCCMLTFLEVIQLPYRATFLLFAPCGRPKFGISGVKQKHRLATRPSVGLSKRMNSPPTHIFWGFWFALGVNHCLISCVIFIYSLNFTIMVMFFSSPTCNISWTAWGVSSPSRTAPTWRRPSPDSRRTSCSTPPRSTSSPRRCGFSR